MVSMGSASTFLSCRETALPRADGIAMQAANENAEFLIRFYLLLGQAIEVTRVSRLPYWEYLNVVKEWTAEVHYSATDDPPPYLSQITTG